MRVAVLGGSSVASIQLAAMLGDWPGGGGRRPPLEFALHGRNPEKLELVARGFATAAAADPLGPTNARAGAVPAAVTSTASLDLAEVLDGADVVLVQVRIGGMAARAFDESFPWAAGLPGEETLGPGGFANALRTLPALEPIWEAILQRCPSATVLVLSNPAGIVRQAAARHGLAALEVCDSPIVFTQQLAARLGRPVPEVAARYVGMNHVGWYVPRDAAELELLAEDQAVSADVVRAHGAVPLAYVHYYVDPDRIYAAQQGKPTRAEQLTAIEREAMDRLASGHSPDSGARPAPWYRLGIIPALDGLANGSTVPMIAGVANAGRVPGLPDDATVEGLVTFSGDGQVQPAPVVDLPPLAASLLARHATYEQLALDAAAEPDPVGIARALLANPMVATADQARVLTELLGSSDPSPARLATPA